MAEICGTRRVALGIDEERQVAADADRVEMIEEEEAIAAEEVLDVVLGGDEEHVDAGLVHELVERRCIERQGGCRGLAVGGHRLVEWRVHCSSSRMELVPV